MGFYTKYISMSDKNQNREDDKVVIMERCDWVVENNEDIIYPEGIETKQDIIDKHKQKLKDHKEAFQNIALADSEDSDN